jgi:hypothetical protein
MYLGQLTQKLERLLASVDTFSSYVAPPILFIHGKCVGEALCYYKDTFNNTRPFETHSAWKTKTLVPYPV